MAYYSMGGQSASVISDLRKQKGTVGSTIQVNGISTENDGSGGNYFWADTSVLADDGYNTIKVDNVTTGRWIRLKNSNANSGTVTINTLLGVGSYDAPHGLSTPPKIVLISPASANASQNAWVSAIGPVNFTISFFTIPIIASTNVKFNWLAIRS